MDLDSDIVFILRTNLCEKSRPVFRKRYTKSMFCIVIATLNNLELLLECYCRINGDIILNCKCISDIDVRVNQRQ